MTLDEIITREYRAMARDRWGYDEEIAAGMEPDANDVELVKRVVAALRGDGPKMGNCACGAFSSRLNARGQCMACASRAAEEPTE